MAVTGRWQPSVGTAAGRIGTLSREQDRIDRRAGGVHPDEVGQDDGALDATEPDHPDPAPVRPDHGRRHGRGVPAGLGLGHGSPGARLRALCGRGRAMGTRGVPGHHPGRPGAPRRRLLDRPRTPGRHHAGGGRGLPVSLQGPGALHRSPHHTVVPPPPRDSCCGSAAPRSGGAPDRGRLLAPKNEWPRRSPSHVAPPPPQLSAAPSVHRRLTAHRDSTGRAGECRFGDPGGACYSSRSLSPRSSGDRAPPSGGGGAGSNPAGGTNKRTTNALPSGRAFVVCHPEPARPPLPRHGRPRAGIDPAWAGPAVLGGGSRRCLRWLVWTALTTW